VHDHVTPARQSDPLNLISLLPHGPIGDSWSDRLQKSVFESEAVTRVTGGGVKAVQALARGGGGGAVAPGGRLAPAVAATPHNRVRVRGLVVGFIADELEKVRGAAGPVAGGGEVARAPPQPRAGPERRSDHGRTHGEERRGHTLG
jgi:hypothetical protein